MLYDAIQIQVINVPVQHKPNVMIVAAKFVKYLKITFINVSTKLKVEEICKDLTN
jgi:hypothetical protein